MNGQKNQLKFKGSIFFVQHQPLMEMMEYRFWFLNLSGLSAITEKRTGSDPMKGWPFLLLYMTIYPSQHQCWALILRRRER
jgi:hypothetical protein